MPVRLTKFALIRMVTHHRIAILVVFVKSLVPTSEKQYLKRSSDFLENDIDVSSYSRAKFLGKIVISKANRTFIILIYLNPICI